MTSKPVCAFVSDGTPGQGDHHSDDIVAVYHGAVEPVHVCGYHASRPDIMAKVYARKRKERKLS